MNGPVVGARGVARMTVGAADTAVAMGSGDVPVLATPRLVALLEAAAVDALRDSLDSASTSVGTHVDVRHVAATGVGGVVEAHAEVTRVAGREVDFSVSAHDQRGEIARGTHRRVVVDRERFLGSLSSSGTA